MSKYLVFKKNLPKKFWIEVINISIYLLNRIPTKISKFNNLYEIYYGVKPNLKHLKVFRSIYYALVLKIKGDKLDHKIDIGVFVGDNNNAKK